jgi:hypothetical protein
LGVDVKVTRSMPTRVFGGRWGRRMVGDGERGRGMAVDLDAVLFL